MRTLDLIKRYFDEQFFIIPLLHSSKIPFEKKWNEKPLTYTDTLDYLRLGYNIGIVGGYQSRKDDMDLVILDFDGRLGGGKIKDNIEKWRSLNTLVQFTPHGFHVFLRTLEKDRGFIEAKCRRWVIDNKIRLVLHRTSYEPKHEDNTFEKPLSKEEHDSYFESLRWNSMYVVASPSRVGDKTYWFLDDMRQEILVI